MNGAHTVFVVALLVAGCATPLPSPMRVAPAAASPSDAVEGEWERLDLPNGDASFNGVAATEHDVVIVGGRAMGAVAWVSHDGGPWTFEVGARRCIPRDCRRVRRSREPVGSTPTNRCAHPRATFFWVRAPNGTWTTAPFDKLFCGGDESTPAVAGGRLAMIGSGTADVPFAWFSDDGLTWVDRPLRHDVYPRFLAPMAGGFAAIGNFLGERWWAGRSDGQKAWTIAPLPNLPLDARAVGLADRGAGLIAWFATADNDVFAMTSETGFAWRLAQVHGLVGAAPGHVIRTAAGFVALAEMPDARPGLFVSRDGVTWRVVAGPIDDRPGNYVGLAISRDRAVLLGDVRVGDEGTPTVWSGPANLFEP